MYLSLLSKTGPVAWGWKSCENSLQMAMSADIYPSIHSSILKGATHSCGFVCARFLPKRKVEATAWVHSTADAPPKGWAEGE